MSIWFPLSLRALREKSQHSKHQTYLVWLCVVQMTVSINTSVNMSVLSHLKLKESTLSFDPMLKSPYSTNVDKMISQNPQNNHSDHQVTTLQSFPRNPGDRVGQSLELHCPLLWIPTHIWSTFFLTWLVVLSTLTFAIGMRNFRHNIPVFAFFFKWKT